MQVQVVPLHVRTYTRTYVHRWSLYCSLWMCVLSPPVVAYRCIPTFINTDEILDMSFANLTVDSNSGMQRYDITQSIGNLTLNEIFDGTG